MLDDIATKVPEDRLGDFELSWKIETSRGNFQGGIILAEPLTDRAEAERLLQAVIDAGLCDRGANGPLSSARCFLRPSMANQSMLTQPASPFGVA